MKFTFLKILISLFLFSELAYSQCDGCNHWYTGHVCEAVVSNPELCNESDILFLQTLIDINNLNEESSLFDADNSNGILEPLELGETKWENGRLVDLNLSVAGLDLFNFDSFGYNIPIIPENIDLAVMLNNISISNIRLQFLPNSIGNLSNLSSIYMTYNDLTYIPNSICQLNVEWNNGLYFSSYENFLCTNIPSCIEPYVGQQDCSWYMWGDTNLDEEINVLDVLNLVNYVLNYTSINQFQEINSDLNNDSIIDILDIVLIVIFILDYRE